MRQQGMKGIFGGVQELGNGFSHHFFCFGVGIFKGLLDGTGIFQGKVRQITDGLSLCHRQDVIKGIDKLFALLRRHVIDPHLDGFVHKTAAGSHRFQTDEIRSQNFPGVGVMLGNANLFAVYHGVVLRVLKEHAHNGGLRHEGTNAAATA